MGIYQSLCLVYLHDTFITKDLLRFANPLYQVYFHFNCNLSTEYVHKNSLINQHNISSIKTKQLDSCYIAMITNTNSLKRVW